MSTTADQRPARTAGEPAPPEVVDPDGAPYASHRLRDAWAEIRMRWALVAAAAVIGFYGLVRLIPLQATDLNADPGIQYYLATITAHGAVPLRDFEHSWNFLSWYLSAAGWWAVDGHATLWLWLLTAITGNCLVAVLVVIVGVRAGLRPVWVLALAVASIVITTVPNGKYSMPILWALVLVLAEQRGGRAPVLARFGLAGIGLWLHIDLVVLLCAGTGLYDLLCAPSWRDRARRWAAMALGLVVAAAIETIGYAAVGFGPSPLWHLLVLDRTGSGAASTFTYSLLDPATLRAAIYPATLIVAFVPLVWRRLSAPTRIVACLHLALALTAIRKADTNHVAAASTLMVLLAFLIAHDLWTGRERPFRLPAARPTGRTAAAAVVGIAWALGSLLIAFSVGSVLALLALVALPALGAWVARHSAAAVASVAALASLVGLVVVGSATHLYHAAQGGADDLQARTMAAAAGPEVDRCLAQVGSRQAWVVPGPLGLYTQLGITNPTRWYLFWPGFASENDQVRAAMTDGKIPAILQVGPWVDSLRGVVPTIANTWVPCATVNTPARPDVNIPASTITVWLNPKLVTP